MNTSLDPEREKILQEFTDYMQSIAEQTYNPPPSLHNAPRNPDPLPAWFWILVSAIVACFAFLTGFYWPHP